METSCDGRSLRGARPAIPPFEPSEPASSHFTDQTTSEGLGYGWPKQPRLVLMSDPPARVLATEAVAP